MESAIRLCLPSASLRQYSGAIGAAASRSSRFHLRLTHESLCLSHLSTRHPVSRSFGPVNCMLDRFSVPKKNEVSDNKILRGVTGISLVLACVIGLCNFSGKMNPKFNTAYAFDVPFPFTTKQHGPSEEKPAVAHSLLKMIIAEPSNQTHRGPGEGQGEAALESLLKMIIAEPSKPTFPQFSDSLGPSKIETEALKVYAARLSKSGQPDEAVKKLEDLHKKYKGRSEAEQFLEMALIALFIFQGKYQEAQRRLDRKIEQILSENNIPDEPNYEKKIEALLEDRYEVSKDEILLYKAIVETMLGKKEAEKWREAFRGRLTSLHDN